MVGRMLDEGWRPGAAAAAEEEEEQEHGVGKGVRRTRPQTEQMICLASPRGTTTSHTTLHTQHPALSNYSPTSVPCHQQVPHNGITKLIPRGASENHIIRLRVV